MKNILLFVGGGGSEHDISLISANYLEDQIDRTEFVVHRITIDKNHKWHLNGLPCHLNQTGQLVWGSESFSVDAAIPCLHGPPGETGDIQSLFEMFNIPYFGCNSETSKFCFNKLVTKLLLENAGVQTTPFMPIENNESAIDRAKVFMQEHQEIFIKATNQGSSVGCYLVTNQEDLAQKIKEAFKYSPYVILEKNLRARELEVAAFEYQGRWHTPPPGEIICPGKFYTFDEKYSEDSDTKTQVQAAQLSQSHLIEINRQASVAIELLKLRHLSRIDFFLTNDDEIFINEINTFPGHTKISMFPMMMENSGVSYSDFINYHLRNLTASK